jgi:NAD(P)-dependent dehydrogenase (short-subunit alcohol dehydrogenase family)
MVKAGKNRDIWRGNISDMDKAVDWAKPPSQLLLTLELRGIWELQAFFVTYPLLGGVFAREMPRRAPYLVRQVITLTGCPEGVPTLAYNTNRGAVVNLTRTLANEWAPFGINVNAIAPGYFPTKMTAQLDTDAISEMAPMKRGGGPEDLTGVTALFASDACAFIAGQTLAVDGGVTAI